MKDIVGKQFGDMIVTDTEFRNRRTYLTVKCIKCGLVRRVDKYKLTKENKGTTHNACIQKKNIWSSDKNHKVLLQIYKTIKNRCNNNNFTGYKDYGGRGIQCLWGTFDEFYADMRPTFKTGLSIERVNNNGHYEKENCIWADNKTQCRNRRSNKPIYAINTQNNTKLYFKTVVEFIEHIGVNVKNSGAYTVIDKPGRTYYKWKLISANEENPN